MRRCFLICYDIRDPKRLRRVLKTMKGYGEHWQLSIFFCVLRAIDRVRLERDLKDVIQQREDQVMLVDLGANEAAAREAVVVLGQSLPSPSPSLLVV